MKKQELIDFLTRYNHWRRGADIPMPRAKDVGVAIEAAIAVIRDSDKDVAEFILMNFEFIK